jgi:hypothetical protein
MINVQNSPMNSKMVGFGYVSTRTVSFTTTAVTVGAGGLSAAQPFTIASPTTDAASLTMVRFGNVGNNNNINGRWLYMPGKIDFISSTSPVFTMAAIIDRTASGQVISVQFSNSSGVSQNVPAITIDVRSYFYTAPW